MSRSRSCRSRSARAARAWPQGVLLSLLSVFTLFPLWEAAAQAPSCRRDESCRRTFERAEAASTPAQRVAALAELQAEYARVPDPRLLVSIGKLQREAGRTEQARASCQRAQALAPADAELQQQARDCLVRAHEAPPPAAVREPAPVVNRVVDRVESKSGPAHAESTTHNNIHVSPQITLSPQVQVSPQFQVMQAAPASHEVRPVHQVLGQGLWRRWWLWTGLGVVAAGAVGLGLGLAGREPNTDGYQSYSLALGVRKEGLK